MLAEVGRGGRGGGRRGGGGFRGFRGGRGFRGRGGYPWRGGWDWNPYPYPFPVEDDDEDEEDDPELALDELRDLERRRAFLRRRLGYAGSRVDGIEGLGYGPGGGW